MDMDVVSEAIKFVLILSGIITVLLLLLGRRENQKISDLFYNLPREHGFLWWIRCPEVFLKDKVVVLFKLSVIPFLLSSLFMIATSSEEVMGPPPITQKQAFKILDEANYCSQSLDCAYLGSICPLGCNILVHRNELKKVKKYLQRFPVECEFECKDMGQMTCQASRCVVSR